MDAANFLAGHIDVTFVVTSVLPLHMMEYSPLRGKTIGDGVVDLVHLECLEQASRSAGVASSKTGSSHCLVATKV